MLGWMKDTTECANHGFKYCTVSVRTGKKFRCVHWSTWHRRSTQWEATGGFVIAGCLPLPHDYGAPYARLRKAVRGFATCAMLLVEILNHGANGGMMQKWSTSWSKVNQHHIWRACKTNGRGLKRRWKDCIAQ